VIFGKKERKKKKLKLENISLAAQSFSDFSVTRFQIFQSVTSSSLATARLWKNPAALF
jgi:hypothetical protein